MNARFGRIALLHGGSSPEREVSFASSAMVAPVLARLCDEVVPFDPAARPLADLVTLGCAAVFNLLHGGAGEDGRMAAALEMLGIKCTGSGHLASALAQDKKTSKLIWLQAGLPTPAWQVVTSSAPAAVDEVLLNVGTELFVKPNAGGSSIAAARVAGQDALPAALAAALEHGGEALAEQFIDGQEVTYGILGDDVLPGIRIDVPDGFYDYAAKYEAATTTYTCPPGLPATVDAEARGLARAAFDALGCHGWGRVDMIIRGREPYLLEVNTIPGMTGHSLVPKAAAAAGIDATGLVARILETAR